MILVPLIKLLLIHCLYYCMVSDFFYLLQPRSLIIVKDRVVILGFITHFIATQLSLRDESRKIHSESLYLFSTKLGQYPILFGLPWFKKHSMYIQFDKNTVSFNSPHCL